MKLPLGPISALALAAGAIAQPAPGDSPGPPSRSILQSDPPPQSEVPQDGQPDPAAARTLDADATKWSFSAAVSLYIVPDDREYIQPTLTADRDWLHLEARYNYEARDTASLWVGCNFSGGKSLQWELTPMIGGVFGEVNGIAPGIKLTLTYWKLQFYTENEFVFDKNDSSNNFFYSWSELSLAPVDWFRFGIVAGKSKKSVVTASNQRYL